MVKIKLEPLDIDVYFLLFQKVKGCCQNLNQTLLIIYNMFWINLARKIIWVIASEYLIFDIYTVKCIPSATTPTLPTGYRFDQLNDIGHIVRSDDYDISKCVADLNVDSFCYVIFKNEELVATCWLWRGEYYKRVRNFLPLTHREGELTYLAVSKQHRGNNLACKLIRYATNQSEQLGFERLYSRIWHSNIPSIRSFIKADWHKFARYINVNIRFLNKSIVYTRKY